MVLNLFLIGIPVNDLLKRLLSEVDFTSGTLPKMTSLPKKLEDWILEAVNLMARSGCSLAQAATEMGVSISLDQVNAILRRPTFQRLFWEARHRYFSELGGDLNFKKDTAIGKMLDLSRKLEECGEFDKASEVLFKISKMTGWVGPESTVNVFGELSDSDLRAIRERVAKDNPTIKGLKVN